MVPMATDPADPSTTSERIIALESRIAFQDHTIASLDEVVREFTRRIEQLEYKVELLHQSMAAGDGEIIDEPPPHY